jgi:glycosyltransferase involved in cell wall biosynthesis
MAAGLPVAATDVGDIKAMVADPNAAFVREPRELGRSLARLADDPALRKHLGAANRQRAASLFDEATMIAAYRDLYWGLAENHRQARGDAP